TTANGAAAGVTKANGAPASRGASAGSRAPAAGASPARAPVVIENPIINSPFAEPARHFRFDDDGITDQIVCERRSSSYFIPIAKPKRKSKDTQMTFDEWTADRIEENKTVNQIRKRVKLWREGGYPDITRTTARLLEHWRKQDRYRRLFF